VAVLAADLPFLDRETVAGLCRAVGGGNGALLVDAAGRDQLLVGVWRTEALRDAVVGPVHGARLSVLLSALDPVRVRLDSGRRAPWFDCDTEADLATARGLA
jgi:molybdopterin-guanine dinucleotide biosynthesis protein A